MGYTTRSRLFSRLGTGPSRSDSKVGPAPRFALVELGGALGDLGTLLPLVVALITVNHMAASGVFLTVGIAYVAAGFYFRLPIPVQPLKAVGAIAIASNLPGSVVSAAGPVLGLILLGLAASGLGDFAGRLFARPVVRGIQLGLGLLLAQTGLLLAARPQLVPAGAESVVRLGELGLPLGIPVAGAVGLVLWSRRHSQRLPAVLTVLGLGVAVSLAAGSLEGLASLRLGLVLPAIGLPSARDVGLAAALLVVPQLPLTLGNAVVSTQRTATDYFGHAAGRVTYRSLLTSMGVLNLMAGFIGGLPICHGSGGLTAHYRFGARTGGASLMIGSGLVALALFVDGNVVPLLALIPYPVLGALLVITGLQHGLLARDVRGWKEVVIVGVVATTGFATGNLALGFALGLVAQGIFWLEARVGRLQATQGA